MPFDEQLNLLRNRGLAVADPARAIKDLKRIGYYRLSGYLYPLRRVEQQPGAKRPRRLDHYVDGAAFEDGVGLHDFDHRLSQCLLDGLQQVEIGLRVKVGYTLGKRGALAHLDPANLGPKARQTSSRLRGQTHYEVWRHQYDQQQAKARNGKQEFVLHFEKKYDGNVPIWAAVEFMTMGCLIALLDLLVPRDQRQIARELGVKDQKTLLGWLRPLNVLRNHCAHGNRVWNRTVVFQADRLNLDMLLAPDVLAHLASSPKAPVDRKVYFHAATTAYLLRAINPTTTWPESFVNAMGTFPDSGWALGLTPQTSMGFPDHWDELALWNGPAHGRPCSQPRSDVVYRSSDQKPPHRHRW
ncbi:Abi family protein [Actinomyces urogenitalis]|uniref:Abi family protein n=1 Tax=Actinomyces urogenitalis TaxID=103621 RepID=UPI002432CA25|nr:Abi family protein [Actinomyces urogenitalis]